MERRRRSSGRRKRGSGLPDVYKNRVYFGKPQTGNRVVLKILANLLKNAGDIIGILWKKQQQQQQRRQVLIWILRSNTKCKRRKSKTKTITGRGVLVTDLVF